MLNWTYAPYILALLGGSAVAFGMALYAIRYRALHGVLPFMGICLATGEWMVGYALEVGSITQADKILWAKVEYLGITSAPLFWLAFALHYTGQEKRVSRTVWGLISVIPVITVLLVFTNEMHGLVWQQVGLAADSRPFPVLVLQHGPWFWVHSATSYLWMLLGSGLLASRLREAGRLYRWQALALLLGLITPWIGNLLYVTDLGPIPHLDLTPFAFIFSTLVFARALFGFRLLDLVPVARRAVMDSMGDGVLALDEQNRIVDLNQAAGRIIGIRPADAIGQPAGQVLREHTDLVARYQGVNEAQAEIVLGGAPPRHFELRIAPLRDGTGHFAGRLITLHDVTERKQADAAIHTLNAELEARVVARTAELEAANQAKDATLLREQAARATAEAAEQRLAFLAEASRLLAGSLDYLTTLTNLAQHAVPTLADWCAVDVQGEDGAFRRVAAVHRDAEKTALVRDLQQRYPADPQASHGFPYVIRTGQPDFWPVVDPPALAAASEPDQLVLFQALGLHSFMCVPLMARGRTLGAMTLVRAEPDRAYTAADLALAQDLARRAAVAVDNARLYHAAQQAVHVRDEFFSIASHELKTPITSMQLAVQALLRATRPDAPPPAAAYLARRLGIVEDQNRRLAHLVDDLLDISRIRAGRLELEPDDMDLAALTRQVVEQLSDELVEAGCVLTLHADAPVAGHWDRARVEQVITNLLTNAMKYGAGRPIVVAVTAEEHTARLTVCDNGIGIAPEQQARIFGRFERAVAPGKYRGMGLGLYIARQIINAHGGTISVTSVPGHGATFTVDLPLPA